MTENFIVIDTETANGLENPLVYDCGWKVTNRYGETIETRSYVNADIFLGEKDLMKSSYYASKIPQYWEDIKSGERILTSLFNIKKQFSEDCKNYNVKQIYGYNMRFDVNALNTVLRWETKSKYRYFFPKGTEFYDIMKMAKDVIGCRNSYRKFCEENGFMTNHKTPRPQINAETVYKYITKNPNFTEEHKGLEDVNIETEIMAYCYRQHKKMRKLLWEKA